MKIKDMYIGSAKGHLITALLTIWFTFGIGNIAYAIVANKMEDKPSKNRWIAMALVFVVLVFAYGATHPVSTTTTTPTKVETATPEATPVQAAPVEEISYTTVSISKLISGSIEKGTHVSISGTVMQNIGDGTYLIRDGSYNVVAVYSSQSVYEGSTLSVNGTYVGPITYTTTLGASKTVPGVYED